MNIFRYLEIKYVTNSKIYFHFKNLFSTQQTCHKNLRINPSQLLSHIHSFVFLVIILFHSTDSTDKVSEKAPEIYVTNGKMNNKLNLNNATKNV